MAWVAWLISQGALAIAFPSATILLLLWLAAVYAVINPHQGLHDRWAGTWVVCR